MFVAAVVVGVVVVVLAVVLLLRRKRRSCVVLYGPNGSGKTALWYRLKTGKFVSTVSSMKENEGTFAWLEDESQQPRHTVDIPG
jgi:GTPase SAR1 family protein